MDNGSEQRGGELRERSHAAISRAREAYRDLADTAERLAAT